MAGQVPAAQPSLRSPTPVVQVHPTRRCNLRCLHCYSSSGPDVDETLPIDVLGAAVEDAAALGYRAMAVSGGEPLLYRPLLDLLDAAHQRGMLTTVSTNGMALSQSGAERLRGRADLVAVSVDGSPTRHDWIRGQVGAFAGMARGVARLRRAGVPFGFLLTLTQQSLGDLPWVLDFALEQGAVLVQVHPLDGQGRALEGIIKGERPDVVELAIAAVVGADLDRRTSGLTVEVDVVTREAAAANPQRFQGLGLVGSARLGDWVHPLVIRSDGEVLPLTHDFPTSLGLGSLYTSPLAALAEAWRVDGRAARFAAVCRRAFLKVTTDGPEISYWYEAFTSAVREDPAVLESIG